MKFKFYHSLKILVTNKWLSFVKGVLESMLVKRLIYVSVVPPNSRVQYPSFILYISLSN